jgi:hypothetical protein
MPARTLWSVVGPRRRRICAALERTARRLRRSDGLLGRIRHRRTGRRVRFVLLRRRLRYRGRNWLLFDWTLAHRRTHGLPPLFFDCFLDAFGRGPGLLFALGSSFHNGVRRLHGGPHRGYVVHTHNRGAVQNRGSHSRRSRKLQASRSSAFPRNDFRDAATRTGNANFCNSPVGRGSRDSARPAFRNRYRDRSRDAHAARRLGLRDGWPLLFRKQRTHHIFHWTQSRPGLWRASHVV